MEVSEEQMSHGVQGAAAIQLYCTVKIRWHQSRLFICRAAMHGAASSCMRWSFLRNAFSQSLNKSGGAEW